ncbi:UNVERIFIED_CONTAM: putative methyltransferase DDB [Sesamum calycinum]|uniref:Methyltransferase DDB n=1 Tax=Sesamum calycinum TaxID=2727403 RepID=A0AAW2KQ01_9LAMI
MSNEIQKQYERDQCASRAHCRLAGLELALIQCLAPLVVEVDARISGKWEVQHLIMRIVHLQQLLVVDVQHVFKDANAAADHLAKEVVSLQLTRVLHHNDITGVLHGSRALRASDSNRYDELVNLIGTEGSVDLITVAQVVHWFDLPRFYSIASRLLWKPTGVVIVWGYGIMNVNPTFDAAVKYWFESTLPYWNSKIELLSAGYKELPFPFESVGLGSEGNPVALNIPKELSFEGVVRMLRSWSAVQTAKEQRVDLLSEYAV